MMASQQEVAASVPGGGARGLPVVAAHSGGEELGLGPRWMAVDSVASTPTATSTTMGVSSSHVAVPALADGAVDSVAQVKVLARAAGPEAEAILAQVLRALGKEQDRDDGKGKGHGRIGRKKK